MKPYGREKIVQQNPEWKRDYHMHEKGTQDFKLVGRYLRPLISFGNQAQS